jgi:hypothetical protein
MPPEGYNKIDIMDQFPDRSFKKPIKKGFRLGPKTAAATAIEPKSTVPTVIDGAPKSDLGDKVDDVDATAAENDGDIEGVAGFNAPDENTAVNVAINATEIVDVVQEKDDAKMEPPRIRYFTVTVIKVEKVQYSEQVHIEF